VRRWLLVGGTGVWCGALLAWLFWALTGWVFAALAIGTAVAAILVVLAVAGARFNDEHKVDDLRRAAILAKRERVRKAIEETRERR
jgi:putative flippase GtrA